MEQEAAPVRLIDLREVERRTGLKRDSIYRLGKLDRMPRPVKVGEWASRWVGAEIDAFVAAKIAERDSSKTPNSDSREAKQA